jgi:hypothetical protein
MPVPTAPFDEESPEEWYASLSPVFLANYTLPFLLSTNYDVMRCDVM